MHQFDLKNKTAIITGGAQGFGLDIAKRFLKSGAKAIIWDIDEEELKKAIKVVNDPNLSYNVCDVSNFKGVKKTVDAIAKNSKIDILINNAGIGSMNHSILIPIKTVQSILNTNVVGTFLLSREAAKLMKQNNFGKIINLVSIASSLKLEGEAAYAASKSAVLTLTEIMAREFAEYGITVNAVGPTPVKTDLIKGVPKEKLDRFLERQAIPKFSTPQDICNIVDFFINKKNDMITGQVLYLGGI